MELTPGKIRTKLQIIPINKEEFPLKTMKFA